MQTGKLVLLRYLSCLIGKRDCVMVAEQEDRTGVCMCVHVCVCGLREPFKLCLTKCV